MLFDIPEGLRGTKFYVDQSSNKIYELELKYFRDGDYKTSMEGISVPTGDSHRLFNTYDEARAYLLHSLDERKRLYENWIKDLQKPFDIYSKSTEYFDPRELKVKKVKKC